MIRRCGVRYERQRWSGCVGRMTPPAMPRRSNLCWDRQVPRAVPCRADQPQLDHSASARGGAGQRAGKTNSISDVACAYIYAV